MLAPPEAPAPVEPEVPEPLEVPVVLPLPEGAVLVELPEAPMPEVEPEVDDPAEPPVALGELADLEPEGVTEPAVEPLADPRPEADPVAKPDIDGPEPQAARVVAKAAARMNLYMGTP